MPYFETSDSTLLDCDGSLMNYSEGGHMKMPQLERRALKMDTASHELVGTIFITYHPVPILSDSNGMNVLILTAKASLRSLRLTYIMFGSSGVMRLRPRYRVMKS